MERILDLPDKQRREILDIYITGKRNNENNESIKAKIADKLNALGISFTPGNLETIFYDCTMYTIIDNMPPEQINKRKDKERKNIRALPLDKKKLAEMARDYLIRSYDGKDIEELRKNGIIDNIVQNIMHKTKEEILADFELKRDLLTFIQDRTKRGDIEEAELASIIDDQETYEILLRLYVENLIIIKKHDDVAIQDQIDRKEVINSSTKYSEESREVLNDSLDYRTDTLKSRQSIRRRFFVSNEEVKRFLESGEFKIALAKDYLYDKKGNRRIKGSLVEEKLLTTYLDLR